MQAGCLFLIIFAPACLAQARNPFAFGCVVPGDVLARVRVANSYNEVRLYVGKKGVIKQRVKMIAKKDPST